MNASFDHFSSNILKPNELKEARLHHVEARIIEEERARVAEFGFVKDSIRKLIVAFENSQLINGDSSGAPALPALGAASSRKHYLLDETAHTVGATPNESSFLPSLLANPRSPKGPHH